MVSGVQQTVEQRAIETAKKYVEANGLNAADARYVGLVLVGLAIGAALTPVGRAEVLRSYQAQFPKAPLDEWARFIYGLD